MFGGLRTRRDTRVENPTVQDASHEVDRRGVLRLGGIAAAGAAGAAIASAVNAPPAEATDPTLEYVGSCHFGKSQCFRPPPTGTTDTVFNKLNTASSAQDRVDLMPLHSFSLTTPGIYVARLRTRLGVTLPDSTQYVAMAQFVNEQTPGGDFDKSIVADSQKSSSDHILITAGRYVSQQTDLLELDLFTANPDWGGWVSMVSWTTDPLQGFIPAAEITVWRQS